MVEASQVRFDEQGLIPELWAPEALFAPATLGFDPNADKTIWADR